MFRGRRHVKSGMPLGAAGVAKHDARMSIPVEPDHNDQRRTGPAPLQIGAVLVDPPVLQAPMAGFTNYAFRQIVRQFGGVGLQATEMVSAKSFRWLDRHQGELPDRLWGVRDEPRPLAVQIWDNDPALDAEKVSGTFFVSRARKGS